MAEPDPKPQMEATVMANGSGPPRDSGAEAVPMAKQGEENKGVEELNVGKENNGSAEMKKEDGRHGVEETKGGIGKEEDEKAKNSAGETKEGGGKNDMKETNGSEETRGSGIKEINGVEETKGREDQNSMKDTNNERDMNDVEEKLALEEKEGGEKIKDREEKETSELKKDDEGKVDEDKEVEDEGEGKRGNGNEDVEMAEAENVKEEDKVGTDERLEDGGRKSEEMGDVKDKGDGMGIEEGDDSKKAKGLKKKRSRSGRKVEKDKGEAKEEKQEAKEKKEAIEKAKEPLTSPRHSSIDRPVRERKTVERLVEVIEKETNKGVVIEKGRGTPLKDIPNVAHKLARKKPGDLKLLHQALFGRKGKAVDFKNHILQFSGFAWHESDEKQRAKVKERLDKYVKDVLLDLCDLLDISVSKANSKKEDVMVKLLDFMAAPHATTDSLLAEKEQDSPKSLKRKRVARGSASKSTEDVVLKKSRKKRMKSDGAWSTREKGTLDTEDEDEDTEHDANENVAEKDDELGHSESDKETESKEASEKDEGQDDEDSGKDKQEEKKPSKKQHFSKKERAKMEGSSRKTPSVASAKSPSKAPSSLRSKSYELNDEGEKVFVRKKKQVDLPKKTSTSKSDIKEKSSGKKAAGGKPKSSGAGQSNPSKEELRKTICEILKKVDFNTATFTDILKQLATLYKVDLTPRKASIKLMIQEELTKLADEAEDNEDDDDSEKEEHRKAEGKKVEV